MLNTFQAVIRPVVTEKSSAAYSQRREYAFEVHPSASKFQVREAIEKIYDVKVLSVRTARRKGLLPPVAPAPTAARATR